MSAHTLNEAETRAELIDPALKAAWQSPSIAVGKQAGAACNFNK